MSRRMTARLLGDLLCEIHRIESYRDGHGRVSFARDGLRRDATERCLERIITIATAIRTLDPVAHAELRQSLVLSGHLDLRRSVARMDSDVLWRLVDSCREELQERVLSAARLVKRVTP
ncbi:hypothetical protein [Roseomonas chloroacetimidivorans]|uniref:hypothetical protein n=1 Tax=Roseomonas chloroacetimidivorans TaxID=1766656 RepID=UPI003C748D84